MKRGLARFFVTAALLFPLATPAIAQVSAVDIFPACSQNAASTNVCKDAGVKHTTNPITHTIGTVISILSYIIGAAAIIGIIVSSLRLITSNGDSNAVASARSSILYCLIGVLIAIAAQTIVIFVLDKIK